MLKVLAFSNVFIGDVHSIDIIGEDLMIHFYTRKGSAITIDVTLPKIGDQLMELIKKVGVSKLKNAVLDLNQGTVKVDVGVDGKEELLDVTKK